MTAPALIKQSTLTCAAKVAKAQGCAIEIIVGNMTIRVTPATEEQQAAVDKRRDFTL